MIITIIGGKGFVGSAFVRHLSGSDHTVRIVTRENFGNTERYNSDIVIDCAGNAKMYLAESQPLEEFDFSVTHALRVVDQYPSDKHILISSVDVYDILENPSKNHEKVEIKISGRSHYGMHKYLAEQVIQHYCKNWMIFRLGGMVGPNIRKNPIYDLINNKPLRIHPESKYHFMHTDKVAEAVMQISLNSRDNDIFNLCGMGLVSPKQVAEKYGYSIDLSLISPDSDPRIVNINTEKVSTIYTLENSFDAIDAFLRSINLVDEKKAGKRN